MGVDGGLNCLSHPVADLILDRIGGETAATSHDVTIEGERWRWIWPEPAAQTHSWRARPACRRAREKAWPSIGR